MPERFQLVNHPNANDWTFFKPKGLSVEPLSGVDFLTMRERQYGITRAAISLEFRLLTGGKLGLYLANMRDKKYYYCGTEETGVMATLRRIGVYLPEAPESPELN